MAKVTIDEEGCVGCGLCEQRCPEVFEMKDDGKAHVKDGGEPSTDLNEVADMCPVSAITVD